MANLNKVFLIGNITRDPELRYIPSGTAVLDLGMAINNRTKLADGTFREDTTFVDVTVWGKTAENCAEYLSKGRSVFVEGRLRMDQWDDKKTGEKRSKLRVTGERVQFLGRARRRPRAPAHLERDQPRRRLRSLGCAASGIASTRLKKPNFPTTIYRFESGKSV